MKFAYKGFDGNGQPVGGSIEAPGRDEAMEALRRKGVFVESVVDTEAATAAIGPAKRKRIGSSKRLRTISVFARQLAILSETGTQVVDAITSLQAQSEDEHFKHVLGDVRAKVEEGTALSQALELHPEYFDAICRSLIAAGESGGCLPAMLARLGEMSRQQVKVRDGIVSAMVYPSLLMCVSLSVLVVMIVFVLPRFEGLFKTVGAELPPTTKILMDISHFTREYWWVVVGSLAGGIFALWTYLGSAGGMAQRDRLLLRMPKFGNVARSLVTARVARVLGVLLEGKVALLDALRLTKASAGNAEYAALLAKAEDRVTRGESVSLALADPRLIAPSVCEALKSGERSGRMGTVLLSVAEFLDEDNEVTVRTLTSIIEPLILIFLGLIVGFVAFSMFLPLLDLTAATGGG